MTTPLQTPLNSWHTSVGARMAPFAGWNMPIQYEGIMAEHHHTRSQASIFDICHMGEFLLSGQGAKAALAKIVTHNLDTLSPGKCRYGFLLNETGGVLDDLIIYCLANDSFMLVVNAACISSDFSWIKKHLPTTLLFTDVSAQTAKIDLQGPKSLEVIETLLPQNWRIGYFSFVETHFSGQKILASRTGYTGELGFELYCPAILAEKLWTDLLTITPVKPVGLGARDTLRLEMGLPLYGQDLDTSHTPVEAGYGSMITSQADFIGKNSLNKGKERLIALTINDRRSARHHDPILLPGGERVGTVTSGSFAPSLGYSVALGYVKAETADQNNYIIQGAKNSLPATRAELPFYNKGTARIKFV